MKVGILGVGARGIMIAPWATAAALALLQGVAPLRALPVSPAVLLAGVVLDAETGSPIRSATVHAIGPATRRLTTTRVGWDGRWSLGGLPEGVYRIIAVAPGFAPAWVEQTRPSPASGEGDELGPGIPMAAGKERRDLVARLERAGSISGRVTTVAGMPVPDVVVTIDGAPVMGAPRVGHVLTERDGAYRLDSVAAGKRLVVVQPNPMPSSRPPDHGWSPVFHPGTTERSEARTVTVRAGEHAGGVDIVVSLPSAHIVMGQLVVPAGAEDVYVQLVSNGGRTLRNLSYLPGNGTVGPDIVDGGHHVMLARGRVGETVLAAWQSVDVAGDAALPLMSLVPTGTVRGRVLQASGGLNPSASLTVGSVLWVDGEGIEIVGEREAEVSADGSFELHGVLGPRRLYVRGAPSGWNVVDVRVARTSVLSSGIEVGPAQAVDGVEVIVGLRRDP